MTPIALVQGLCSEVAATKRFSVAKAITLLESTKPAHRLEADELLHLLQQQPQPKNSLRLGITGVPGVGKSTFIEALGLELIKRGHRVAVLAVDPSSSLSGGSILGDKTRMQSLSVNERAFIRPSPNGGNLGGVCEKTRECMLICEHAGFDVVIVETVGVGQSEVAVANMTDFFVLLHLPNAGDDLQAMKKGVMEFADFVVINKADLDPDAAMRAQSMMSSAMRMVSPYQGEQHAQNAHASMPMAADNLDPKEHYLGVSKAHALQIDPTLRVLQISALQNQGIDVLLDRLMQYQKVQLQSKAFEHKRAQQAVSWLWERVQSGLKTAFMEHPRVQAALPSLLAQVGQGLLEPSSAARELLKLHRI